MQQKVGVHLVGARQLLEVQRFERGLVFAQQAEGFLTGSGIDLVEFVIRAVVADHRGVDRRKARQIGDVLVGEVLESLVGRAGGDRVGTQKPQDQGDCWSLHGGFSAPGCEEQT